MSHIRRAGKLDTRAMADLLNEIIAQGGTTALTDPVDAVTLTEWMEREPRAIWHVAEGADGTLLGFQWVEPHPELGATVAQIATFVRLGKTGLGIGSALFEVTRAACIREGYDWINAEIRSDNPGGLAYYQSRGFEDYGNLKGYVMGDGSLVDKTLKRYELE